LSWQWTVGLFFFWFTLTRSRHGRLVGDAMLPTAHAKLVVLQVFGKLAAATYELSSVDYISFFCF
jgi:hypothetical protein